jgi:CIC family chloride channel protein
VLLSAALVGGLTGLFVAGFDSLVVDAMFDHEVRLAPVLLAVLPALGLIGSMLARRLIAPGTTPATADEYLVAFHDPSQQFRWRPFAARIVAAVSTLGFGVPLGLEGPSIYGGAFIGANAQRRLRLSVPDQRSLMVAGSAAGVSAIFKAPLTGAVFALEVPYLDDLARRMLLPALVGSGSGYLVFASIKGTTPLFPVDALSGFAVRDLLGAMAVGVVAGLGARAFAWMLGQAKRVQAGSKHRLGVCLGASLALAALFAIGWALTDEPLMIGPGYHVVRWASEPGHSALLLAAILVLRCLATTAAVAGGGVGGLFVPLVVAGALTGSLIASVVAADDLSLFIVVGVAAFLGAGYRVPLAAVTFVAEATGRPSFIVPGLFAAVAAELTMGMVSVTSYQRDPASGRQSRA